MCTVRVIATLMLAFAAMTCAAADVPENLKPSADEVLALQVKASGMQKYICRARKSDPSSFEWTFVAPEAELYDMNGKRFGRHYEGPTWESDDGSKVVGEVKARSDAPDANAIPWLLLTAKSKSGDGALAKTTSIQRVETKGGKAPADSCLKQQVGEIINMPYTAIYNFYRAK